MNRFRAFLLAALAISAVAFTPDVLAQDTQVDEDFTTFQLITRKLGRGISNVGFGVLELPIYVLDVNYNEGGIAALTYGILFGTGVFIGRELVGVLEILTFYTPLPNCPMNPYGGKTWGYGPIMRPEWIITPETNAYNFVFPTSRTMY